MGYRLVRKIPENCEVWYRADDKRYANYDPYSDVEPSGSHLVIEITPYKVLKHTPKGVLLQNWMGQNIQVLGTAIKQEAVPTIELALQDLVRRKEKHVKMEEIRTARARQHLEAATRLWEREKMTLKSNMKVAI